MFKPICNFLALTSLAFPVVAQADSASLLSQTQAANPTRYSFVVNKNAEFRNTADNKSFTVWWQPSSSTAPSGVIVPLHGHGSYATDEIYLWQPYAEKYGYAILALQWWFGGGEATSDYYEPKDIYPIISSRLKEKGVKPRTAFFIGYSRGSANSYAVTALDASSTGSRYFALTLSNSGGAASGYPPNQQIDAGAFGSMPFDGVKWAMYCGEKDPDPNINGCPAMTAAKSWVTKYGAIMVLFIDDPNGDHSGFMTNSSNVEKALSSFKTALATDVSSDCLFNWLELTYPSYIAPARQPSQTSGPYYYRYYPTTKSYAGISAADNHLYYLSTPTGMMDLGPYSDRLPQAGCK